MVLKTSKYFAVSVLVLLVGVCLSRPVAAEITATLTFSGVITEVQDRNSPFPNTAVGDTWTLSYTFIEVPDVDGSETVGQFRNLVTEMTLNIGGVTVSGEPGLALPNNLHSLVGVNMDSAGYADYTAMTSLPDASAWAQVLFYDYSGTPFTSDELPTALPAPLEEAFPDIRRFVLRNPLETSVSLVGEIDEISQPPATTPSFSQVRADTRVTSYDDYVALDLLVNSELFGEGGIAAGMFSDPSALVMGLGESPFIWTAVSDQGSPADGEVGMTIILDKQGQVMGFGESPFRVFLETDEGTGGEIGFDNVVGFYPGILGDLDLGGLTINLPDQSLVDLDYFELFDDADEVIAGRTQADFKVIEGPEYDYVSMVTNFDLFGIGGVAAGNIMCPGCEVMGVEPSPFRWVVDPLSGVPEDGEEVVNFILNPGGEVMGVEPSPFRVLAVSGEEVLGELDFSMVSGYLGSLHLTGIRIKLEDGSFIGVADFDSEESFVDIDIMPGSDTNSINLNSSGVIPVAIISSLVFDATEVDPETVSLAGASIKLVGKSNKMLAHIEDVDGDGWDDLVCQVLTDQLAIEPGASFAVLEAQTYDGLYIKGQDSIQIVSD